MQLFSTIPDDINWGILSHLDASTLAKACAVSKLWNSLLSKNELWQPIVNHIQRREREILSFTTSYKNFVCRHALETNRDFGQTIMRRLKHCMQSLVANTTLVFNSHFLSDSDLFFSLRFRISDGWQPCTEPLQEEFCLCMQKVDPILERISDFYTLNSSVNLAIKDINQGQLPTFLLPFKLTPEKANLYCRIDYRLPKETSNFLIRKISTCLQTKTTDFQALIIQEQNRRIQHCQITCVVILLFLTIKITVCLL